MARMTATLATLALLSGALDLAPSFAHLVEAPPRLWVWPLALWRDATVFHGQFAVLGWLGAPLELAGIGTTAALAWHRRGRPGGRLALVAAIGFLLALAAWAALVAPANAALAAWRPGPLPADADFIRRGWETGHIVCAVLKLVAFSALAASVAMAADPPANAATN